MSATEDDGLDLISRPGSEPPTGEDAERRAWGISVVVGVCAALTVVLAGWGAIDWVFLVVAHATPDISFGAAEPPTSWLERDDAQRAARRVLIGGGVAVVGAVVAWRARRPVAMTLLGGFATVCLVSGWAMHAAVTPDRPAERVPRCMEHSGEPDTCPGG